VIQEGTTKPILETVGGRKAVTFTGGKNGTSYLKSPVVNGEI
jgi:hypothetical protein